MSSPHICLACRRSIRQLRPTTVVQWRSRAAFISLSNNKPRSKDARSSKDGQLKSDEYDGVSAVPPRRKTVRPKKDVPGDVLESLFEQTIHPQRPEEQHHTDHESILEPYQKVQELSKMMKDGAPYPDQWAFFVENFGPAAQRARGIARISMPSFLRPTISSMWHSIVQAKENGHPLPESLPTTAEISRVFMELGYLQGHDWIEMVSHPIRAILTMRNRELDDPEMEKRHTEDLIGAWNIACRDIGQLENIHDSDSPFYWSSLPAISTADALKVHKKLGSHDCFGLLVPSFSLGSLKAFPVVALATFGLLTERTVATEKLNIDVSPLLMTLSRVISVPGLDYSRIYSPYSTSNVAQCSDYVKANWTGILARAAEMAQYHHPEVDKTKSERVSRAPVQISVSYINRRLHEAFTKKNLRQVDEIWADVSKWPVNTSSSDGPSTEPGTMSITLANYLILVYMGLRQPNRAIDVWNHMVNTGLTPTLRTWDSMMTGTINARDPRALEQVWTKMRMAQVEPDTICWATRVGGLLTCRRTDAGVAALDEMGRIWIEAARRKYPSMEQSELQLRNDVAGAVKPSIEVINAAIGALFKNNLAKAAYKILAWAGKFGIAPNVDTYNALLGALVREGRSQEAMALLQRMHKTGVQPDSYTFTTILDETFRSVDGHTPEEAKEIVQSVFTEMELAGLKPNVQIFGKIIRQLLPQEVVPPEELATVHAVIDIMHKQGVEPNSFIFTMLLEQYFAQTPPDMDAVRNTIERASNTKGGTDGIFWDRAIEGYARLNETGPAMRILGKVQASKGRVGWTAMRLLLLALVENQEWEMAKTLVNNAIIDNGAPVPREVRGHERQLSWEFWMLARQFGLVEQGPEPKAQHIKNTQK
ncbi:hypothetical protein ONS96_000266 [Cadophora gregata f. sp. sojae]|nr:hypothetical protein ONS96_000266 [Cadophora gregata f. sp. sojae]